MGTIYKITNLVNNKIYIGQTVNSINHRFNQHINSAIHFKGCPYLGKAIRKYGSENFKIDVIEDNISTNALNDREKYWIKYYKSNNTDFGYNLTRGGNLTCVAMSEEDENLINQLWDSGKTVGYIAEITLHSVNAIDRVLSKNSNYSISESLKRGSAKAISVCQYDLLGTFIKKYNTLTEAAIAVNGCYQGIGQACINKKTAYGYWWRYENELPPNKADYLNCKHVQKPIIQVDLNEEIIYQRFENATDAAKYCGKKDCSSILSCCKGKRKSAYGFRWKFCDIDFHVQKRDDIPDAKLQKQPRKVICLNNKKVFNTLKEAQEYCGLSSCGQIIYSCNNNKSMQKYKHAGKNPVTNERLAWMYYEDYVQPCKSNEKI